MASAHRGARHPSSPGHRGDAAATQCTGTGLGPQPPCALIQYRLQRLEPLAQSLRVRIHPSRCSRSKTILACLFWPKPLGASLDHSGPDAQPSLGTCRSTSARGWSRDFLAPSGTARTPPRAEQNGHQIVGAASLGIVEVLITSTRVFVGLSGAGNVRYADSTARCGSVIRSVIASLFVKSGHESCDEVPCILYRVVWQSLLEIGIGV